jgi:copper homeostasis protein
MIKEVCVETFEGALLAKRRGANRIELCSDLAKDGLTPSFELMKKVCNTLHIPVMVMARPRPGNFVFSEDEIEQTKNDIDLAKKAGAAGIVIGLLTAENKIDLVNTKLLAEFANPLPVTFHKAIDELNDPVEGVKQLLKINNVNRVLTSGGEPTAKKGAKTIQKMMEATQSKIIILVAGKVTDSNLKEICELTGAKEFHGRKIVGDLSK